MIFDSKKRLLRAAEKFALQGRFEQAIAQYLKVLESAPDDPSVLSIVGDLYTRLGKNKQAVHYYTQVAEHYRSFNYLPKAIAVYRKVVQLEPNNFDLALMLANLCDEEGQKSDALRQYQDLAQKYSAAGNTELAVNMLQRCIRLDPLNPHSLAQMGKILSESGSHSQAETYLLDAAEAFLQRGYKRQAHPLFLKVLGTRRDQGNALMGLLRSSTSLQEFSEVKVFIGEALKNDRLDPSLRDALSEEMGTIALSWEQYEEAYNAFRYTGRRNEGSAAKQFLLLLEKLLETSQADLALQILENEQALLIRQEACSSCLPILKKLNLLIPEQPGLLKITAEMHHAQGHVEEALDSFNQAANQFMACGMTEEAIAAVEKMITIDPVHPEYWSLHEEFFRKAHPDRTYTAPQPETLPPVPEEPVEEPPFPEPVSMSLPEEGMPAGPGPAADSLSFQQAETEKMEVPADIDSFFQNLFDLSAAPEPDTTAAPAVIEPPVPAESPEFVLPDSSAEEPLLSPDLPVAPMPPEPPPARSVWGQESGDFSLDLEDLEEDSEEPFLILSDQEEKEDSSQAALESIDESDMEFEFELIEEEESPARETPAREEARVPTPLLEPAPKESELEMVEMEPGPTAEGAGSYRESPIDSLSEEDIARTIDGFFAGLDSKPAAGAQAFEELYAQGLAFKEIGMWNEAMESLQKAYSLVKDNIQSSHYFECSMLLSSCAAQLGQYDLALQYLDRAALAPKLDKSQKVALRYQMAATCELLGDRCRMRQELEWIISVDPNYRDVKGKLKSIQ